MSVLVSTQNIEEAENLSSRILIINEGRKIMFETPKNIKNKKEIVIKINS